VVENKENVNLSKKDIKVTWLEMGVEMFVR